MKGTIISTDGSVRTVELGTPTEQLGALQAEVGGFVEVLKGPDVGGPSIIWVNEDGKRLNLPVNELATRLFLEHIAPVLPGERVQNLLGNVVVTGAPDETGESTDIPDALAALMHSVGLQYAERETP